MLPLTKKQIKSYNKQNFCHICKEEFNEELSEDKTITRFSITAITQGNTGVLPIVSVI